MHDAIATPEAEVDDPHRVAEAPPEPEPAPTGWWRRPGGGREVAVVAAPLVISSLSWTVMTFVDRVLLNLWSGPAMAAAFLGSMAWFAALCLPLGLCGYTGTFVAQYLGSERLKRIGPATWQGVWMALAATPLVLAPIPFAEPLFRLAGHSGDALMLESRYFAILCWGAPATLLAASLSSFYSGRGKTVVIMIVDSLFAALNLLLDWWWIFGLSVAGTQVFPAMGIEGAGWATVVSLWLKTAVYLALVLRRAHREAFDTGAWRPDAALLRRMLYYGAPNGLQILLDVIGFTIFVFLVGSLGEVAVEATSMTFSIGSLAFMPCVGIGMAASILVGQHLGEDRPETASCATWTSLQLAWLYMVVVSALLVFAPGLFLWGFYAAEPAAEADPGKRAAVAATAAVLMRFVAAYNLLDAMAIVFVSAIKGAGDTRFVLWTSLVMGGALGGLTWLGVRVLGLGVYACWGLISAWIAALGVIFLVRFLGGKWKLMRVIETVDDD